MSVPGGPTGITTYGGRGFRVSAGGASDPARFIYACEDGRIRALDADRSARVVDPVRDRRRRRGASRNLPRRHHRGRTPVRHRLPQRPRGGLRLPLAPGASAPARSGTRPFRPGTRRTTSRRSAAICSSRTSAVRRQRQRRPDRRLRRRVRPCRPARGPGRADGRPERAVGARARPVLVRPLPGRPARCELRQTAT